MVGVRAEAAPVIAIPVIEAWSVGRRGIGPGLIAEPIPIPRVGIHEAVRLVRVPCPISIVQTVDIVRTSGAGSHGRERCGEKGGERPGA